MKVSVLQSKFNQALAAVSRAIESKPAVDALRYIHISADDGRIKLTATNFEMTISTYIGAVVEMEGAVMMPAKQVKDMVKNMPGDRMDLTSLEDWKTEVTCGRVKVKLAGLDPAEFPLFESVRGQDACINAGLLRAALSRVLIACATTDGRPVLTGVSFNFSGDKLTLAGADGYRLAVETLETASPNGDLNCTLIVPVATLKALVSLLNDKDQDVYIAFPTVGRDNVAFTLGVTTLMGWTIPGNFPDFKVIMPGGYNTLVTFYTADLLSACKMTVVLSGDNVNSVDLVLGDNQITIAGKSREHGDAETTIEASVVGEPITVTYNIKYLVEIMTAAKDYEQMTLKTMGGASPGEFGIVGLPDFNYLVMPMTKTK